ncbi:MAG TPA: cyclic nucleotide-binding domain-containing protein [Blastocatellia bacterium]|nr:cyclic nucleotide-binding domain-containing protein [Blastocatellia bacterium]
MPQEIQKRRDVLAAIKSVAAIADITAEHAGHFEHEIDLEVIVYGRNYNGKKVGPYVRLLVYQNGEDVMREGEWGGNTFYVVVEGKADVLIDSANGIVKVAEISQGDILGEMSILAGVPRSATVRAPQGGAVKVLEVQRPALRLLRKLPHFGESLDRSYRHHGRNQILQVLGSVEHLSTDAIKALEGISQFRVYGKGHVLFRAGEQIRRVYLLKTGWLRMSQQAKTSLLAAVPGYGNVKSLSWDTPSPDSYFGPSHAFGLEGVQQDATWRHSGVLLGRTEMLEVSVSELRKNPQLVALLGHALQTLEIKDAQADKGPPAPVAEAQRELIANGLVDGTNLLLMDMELCVRCGNCSLACNHQHGNSRLLRRGISITRPETLKKNSHTQHLMNPSVCMHCMDPECMTGCPTGAIGRFPGGYVDIDPKTCIGCGDCATQCPYDAISLIARRPKPGEKSNALVEMFSLAPAPIPESVETTEDLVAVKCNLCSNTPLNPPGAKSRKYSCEENCPTGALLRVSPRVYFDEIANIEGVIFKDDTHIVSKHTSHRDPKKRLIHLLGIVLTLALAAVSVAALYRIGRDNPLLGSWFNFYWFTGIVGLLAITWVMLYPIRRQIFRKRVIPLRYWMLSHAYMGVIAGVLLLMHAGTRGGGLLTTSLMITFDLVILTGLWGIATYYVVPRVLTKIEEQPLLVDDLILRRQELTEEIADTVARASQPTRDAIEKGVIPHFLTFGYLLGQYFSAKPLAVNTAEARKHFEQTAMTLPPNERDSFFGAVERAATLRRVDALILLHRSLKAWLAPHVLTTSLMLALMIVHIIQVIYFAVK